MILPSVKGQLKKCKQYNQWIMLSPDPAVLSWQLSLRQSHRPQRSVPTLVSWCLQLSLPALLLSAAKQILKLHQITQDAFLQSAEPDVLLQLSTVWMLFQTHFHNLEPTFGISCKLFFKDSEMPCMRKRKKNYLIFSVS